MKVKVCGNRCENDIRTAINNGADAIGLISGVHYVSEDAIEPQRAAELLKIIPPFVVAVLVTHLCKVKDIIALHNIIPTPVIQLHDEINPKEYVQLRDSMKGVKLIQAVHVTNSSSITKAMKIADSVDAILLDTRTEHRIGGTGKTHDWSISRKIVQSIKKPVILAGGLNPDNLNDAIVRVNPYAVDVNSGLDNDKGDKDPVKVRRFLGIAKSFNGF